MGRGTCVWIVDERWRGAVPRLGICGRAVVIRVSRLRMVLRERRGRGRHPTHRVRVRGWMGHRRLRCGGGGGRRGAVEQLNVVGREEALAAVEPTRPPISVHEGQDLDDVSCVERQVVGFLAVSIIEK